LAIVKHVVEMAGGSIRVESPGEGLGSTFVVEFVNAPGADLQGGPADASSTGRLLRTSIAGILVLVVEDDDDARAFVARLLSDAKADVCEVANAHDAMEALEGFVPQVVVSDIGMPGVDGYDLIRAIRRRTGPTDNVPAIALTAFVRDDDRRRALQAGYDLHLPKPVDAARLLEAVHALTSPSRST
jgi:CheY-like chemotaxis protein